MVRKSWPTIVRMHTPNLSDSSSSYDVICIAMHNIMLMRMHVVSL